jgi:hypothetical protein
MANRNVRRGSAWPRAAVIAAAVAGLALVTACPGGEEGKGEQGAAPRPPSVTSLAARTLSETEEGLSGTVSPNGKDTEYWFEWGADEALAAPFRTSPSPIVGSVTEQTVIATVSGLAPGQHFHWRLAARNADGTADGAVKPCHHYASLVFVSSARGTGNLGAWPDAGGKTGLAAGDAVCQGLADRAGLQGGPFKAWLSDPGVAARDRLVRSAGAYVRPDGVRVASSWSAMTAACSGGGTCLQNPICINERGASEPATGVYTSTLASGAGIAADPCVRWTSGSGAAWTVEGYSLSTDRRWTASLEVPCDASLPLYCFQQNLAVPQEPYVTGCSPYAGYFLWAVTACSDGLNQDPDCAAICCGFWTATAQCSWPAVVGAYRVTSCTTSPDRVYRMDVTYRATAGDPDRTFTVACRTWEGTTAAAVPPPPGLWDRLRLLVRRASEPE